MTKAAVILSGCGHQDGAEIREAVLSLLYLDVQKVKVTIFAPDIAQRTTVNHITHQEQGESRNVMVEAARIARGELKSLAQCRAGDFDLLVIPGGFGVAKNLSTVAEAGANAALETDFGRVLKEFYEQKKPIGAICIAPAAVAVALKNSGITLTIGEDAGTAGVIHATGNQHQNAATHEAVIDREHRIASCSAYMRHDAPLAEVARGIEQVITAVVEMSRGQSKQAA